MSRIVISARSGVHSAFTDNDGGLRSSNADGNPGPFIYYMGVIDILTTYNIKKRLEHFGKSITAGVSANPRLAELGQALT